LEETELREFGTEHYFQDIFTLIEDHEYMDIDEYRAKYFDLHSKFMGFDDIFKIDRKIFLKQSIQSFLRKLEIEFKSRTEATKTKTLEHFDPNISSNGLKGIGYFWTWDIDKADLRDIDEGEGTKYIISALIHKKDVNWYATLFSNLDTTTDYEKELLPRLNAELQIIAIDREYLKNPIKTLPFIPKRIILKSGRYILKTIEKSLSNEKHFLEGIKDLLEKVRDKKILLMKVIKIPNWVSEGSSFKGEIAFYRSTISRSGTMSISEVEIGSPAWESHKAKYSIHLNTSIMTESEYSQNLNEAIEIARQLMLKENKRRIEIYGKPKLAFGFDTNPNELRFGIKTYELESYNVFFMPFYAFYPQISVKIYSWLAQLMPNYYFEGMSINTEDLRIDSLIGTNYSNKRKPHTEKGFNVDSVVRDLNKGLEKLYNTYEPLPIYFGYYSDSDKSYKKELKEKEEQIKKPIKNILDNHNKEYTLKKSILHNNLNKDKLIEIYNELSLSDLTKTQLTKIKKNELFKIIEQELKERLKEQKILIKYYTDFPLKNNKDQKNKKIYEELISVFTDLTDNTTLIDPIKIKSENELFYGFWNDEQTNKIIEELSKYKNSIVVLSENDHSNNRLVFFEDIIRDKIEEDKNSIRMICYYIRSESSYSKIEYLHIIKITAFFGGMKLRLIENKK
jgi:hypothetical protein